MSETTDTMRSLVVVDPEDAEFLRQSAAAEGVTAELLDEDNFLDPLTVSFVLFGSTAAVGTVTYLLERHKGGQVFDLRPDAPRAEYRSKDIAYGLVKIVAVDGKVTVEVKEPRGLIGQVLDAIKGTIVGVVEHSVGKVGDAVKEAVKKTAGDAATVVVEPVAA